MGVVTSAGLTAALNVTLVNAVPVTGPVSATLEGGVTAPG